MPYNTTSESFLHMTGSGTGCLLRHNSVPCSQSCGSHTKWDGHLPWQLLAKCDIIQGPAEIPDDFAKQLWVEPLAKGNLFLSTLLAILKALQLPRSAGL